MKFSLFAVPALVGAAFAAPVEKRQVSVGNVLSVVEGLFEKVKDITGAINGTTITLSVNDVNVPITVVSEVAEKIQNITSLIDTILDVTDDLGDVADNTVQGLVDAGILKVVPAAVSTATGVVSKRQTELLSGVLSNLLLEVNGTLSTVQNTIGLDAVFDVVEPLATSLSTLLGDVDSLVGGVLTAVESILTGLPIVGGTLSGVLAIPAAILKNIPVVGSLTAGLTSGLTGSS